jgi:putative lipoprotein
MSLSDIITSFLLVTVAAGGAGAQDVWADVQEREWLVVQLGGNPPRYDTALTLRLDRDGKVSGHAGTNRFTGNFTHSDTNALDIGPMATTRIFLDQPPGRMAQESAYLEALRAADRITLDQGRLILLRGDHEIVRLRPD